MRRFDHVGITAKDLDTVTAFLVGLGVETEGRTALDMVLSLSILQSSHAATGARLDAS